MEWTEETFKKSYVSTLHTIIAGHSLDELQWVALNRLYTVAMQDGDAEAMKKYDTMRVALAKKMNEERANR